MLSGSGKGAYLPCALGSIITAGVVWGVGGENDQEGKSPVLYDISYLCASCSVRPYRAVAPYKATLFLGPASFGVLGW